MRTMTAVLASLLAVSGAWAQDAPQTRIRVTLEDGSVLGASISISSVTIQSGVGKVDVGIDQVKSIRLSPVGDEIVLAAEGTLKGKIVWENVKAKSDVGEVTLHREHVRVIEIVGAVKPAEPKVESKPQDAPRPEEPKAADPAPQPPKPEEPGPTEAKPVEPPAEPKPEAPPQEKEEAYVIPDMGYSDADHDATCVLGEGRLELNFLLEHRRTANRARYTFGLKDGKASGPGFADAFNTCRQCRGFAWTEDDPRFDPND